MSGKVGYELAGRHLVVRVEGSYSTQQLLDAIASGLEALEPGLRALVLIDARASTAARPTAEVRAAGAAVVPMASRIERMAIVVGSEVHFGLARMASMLAGEVGASSEVFRDLTEAHAYLDRPPEG